MIPRRIPFPKRQIERIEKQLAAGELPQENAEKAITFFKSRYFNQNRLKRGEGDPKLARGVLQLVQGISS